MMRMISFYCSISRMCSRASSHRWWRAVVCVAFAVGTMIDVLSSLMALYSCPECSHNYSSKALACPGCGKMVRGRLWWITTIGWGIVFSAVISFFLVACLYLLLYLLLGPLVFMR